MDNSLDRYNLKAIFAEKQKRLLQNDVKQEYTKHIYNC